MTLRGAWSRLWFAPVPAIRLAAFRQVMLFTLVFYLVERWRFAGEWLTAAGFHPTGDPLFGPKFPLVPGAWLPGLGVLLFGSVGLAIFGVARRSMLVVALALVIVVSGIDPVSAFTLNRLYIFVLVILALAPRVRDGLTPAWPERMLQVHLLVHYFAAGLCKLREDWSGGGDVLWMQVQGVYMTEAAAWLVRTLPAWSWTGMQYTALGFELLAPLLFLVRRLRPLGIALGLGFHLIVAVTMYQLIYFSLQMLGFYVLFLEPATLERWQARLGLKG